MCITSVNLEKFQVFSHVTYFPNWLRITLIAITMFLFLPTLAFDIWFYLFFARNASITPVPEPPVKLALTVLIVPLAWCVFLDCALAAVSLRIVIGLRARLEGVARIIDVGGGYTSAENGAKAPTGKWKAKIYNSWKKQPKVGYVMLCCQPYGSYSP